MAPIKTVIEFLNGSTLTMDGDVKLEEAYGISFQRRITEVADDVEVHVYSEIPCKNNVQGIINHNEQSYW